MIRVDTRPRRRNSTKAEEAKRLPGHLAWIRGRPCFMADRGGCRGRIEAVHVDAEGSKGVSSKCGDWAVIPGCEGHHAEIHEGASSFERRHGVSLVALAEAYVRAAPRRRELEEMRSAWRAQHLPRLETVG